MGEGIGPIGANGVLAPKDAPGFWGDLGTIGGGKDGVVVEMREYCVDVVGVLRREPVPTEPVRIDGECHAPVANSTAGFRYPVGSKAALTARMAAMSPGVRAMPR